MLQRFGIEECSGDLKERKQRIPTVTREATVVLKEAYTMKAFIAIRNECQIPYNWTELGNLLDFSVAAINSRFPGVISIGQVPQKAFV